MNILMDIQTTQTFLKSVDWSYFATLTLDHKLNSDINLTDPIQTGKRISLFMEEYKKKNPEFEYLFIGELHDSGCIHYHGFIKGISTTDVRLLEHGQYDFLPFTKEIGYSNMSSIHNLEKAVIYIIKYMQVIL